jgi:phosphotransferase system IIB component
MMHDIKYQQRSLLLLLPLGLLAIVSYALDKRIPIGIEFSLQNRILDICRVIIPGFFAIAVACLIPTFNRTFQLFIVGFNYMILAVFSLLKYHTFFSQPTAWVLSALVATLFLIPNSDLETDTETISFKALLAKACGALLAPPLLLLTVVVLIKNIEHSILITFTSVFVDSALSCLFVPIYEIMLTLGFSSLLNSLVSLQSESEPIHAILNSIMLTNLVALPTLILVRASFSKSYTRLFLVFLALITCLTSKIGSCISVELTILMFFFPGTFMALCLSSIGIFFICFYLQLSTFTNFYLLYQPDLILRNLAFMQLSTGHSLTIILSVAIPLFLQIIFSRIGKINQLRAKFRQRFKNSNYNIKNIDNPDLFLIAILNAIGGKSNLKETKVKNKTLFITVFNYKKVSTFQIHMMCKKKVDFIRSENIIKLSIGEMSAIVGNRLTNIIKDSEEYTNLEVPLSKPFNIRNYALNIQEKSKRERYRLDSN